MVNHPLPLCRASICGMISISWGVVKDKVYSSVTDSMITGQSLRSFWFCRIAIRAKFEKHIQDICTAPWMISVLWHLVALLLCILSWMFEMLYPAWGDKWHGWNRRVHWQKCTPFRLSVTPGSIISCSAFRTRLPSSPGKFEEITMPFW